MNSLGVSRRRMMSLLGAAVALTPSLAKAGPAVQTSRPSRPASASHDANVLLAPLAAGSRLASWRVERVSDLRHGAITVALTDLSGETFYLDICQRDDAPGAAVPPGRSDRCDVFVANLGDGAAPTVEDHGLAAMAVAEVLRANEHQVRIDGLLTLRQRLAQFPDQVLRGF